jgi:hypothetical protein
VIAAFFVGVAVGRGVGAAAHAADLRVAWAFLVAAALGAWALSWRVDPVASVLVPTSAP